MQFEIGRTGIKISKVDPKVYLHRQHLGASTSNFRHMQTADRNPVPYKTPDHESKAAKEEAIHRRSVLRKAHKDWPSKLLCLQGLPACS